MGVMGMSLKIVALTSLNIDQVYPDTEWTFPRPRPTDILDRRRAWIMEMLSKGFPHFSAFNAAGEKVALVEYMPIEESLDNIVGENVNSIHCLWDKTDPENGKPTQALLDRVEDESFKVGRGVVIVAWRMKDLLIKRNYKVIGEQEGYFLALKASAPNQYAAFITHRRIPQVELIKGKVTIDVFWNVWCSYCAHGLAQLEWVRQACNTAAQEIGERIILREHLIDRANTLNYGIGEQHIVLINGEKWSGRGYDKDDDPKPFIQKIKELTLEVYQDSLR